MWDGSYRRTVLEIFNALKEDALEFGEGIFVATRGRSPL